MKTLISLSPFLIRIAGYIMLLFFAIFPWMAAVLARATNIFGGGLAGGFIGGLVGIVMGIVPGAVVFAFFVPLGFFFDWAVTRNYRQTHSAGKIPAWWAGGKWGISELEKPER